MRFLTALTLVFGVLCLTAFTPSPDIRVNYDEKYSSPEVLATVIVSTKISTSPPASIITPVVEVRINLKVIAIIESTNNHAAMNPESGARGKYQLMRSAWEEGTKHFKKEYDYDDWKHISKYSYIIADWYMHERIPEILKSYNIPVTVQTTIAAWNYGPTNFARIYKKSKNWIKYLPKETQNYLNSYADLVN